MKSLLIILFVFLFGSSFAQTNITQAEYFFDTDPGFGSASAIAVTAASTLSLNNFNISTQNLPEGIHFLYIRCKDANNKWSIPVRKIMYINANFNAPSAIVAAEYFFDIDLGFGSANAIAVTAGNTLSLNNFNIATQNLAEGIHFLYLRCKDANNKWSIPVRKVMYIHANFNSPSPIVAAEYFVDADPGVGFGNTINSTAGNSIQLDFDASTSGLSVGNHFLYVRVKNQNNAWSVASKRQFTIVSQLSVAENLIFDYKIYPNPTTGIVTISNQDNLAIDKIEIRDVLGKKVAVKTENTSQVDISRLANGIYVFKIYSRNTSIQKKIIKQ